MNGRIFNFALVLFILVTMLGAANQVNANTSITAGAPTIVSYQGKILISGHPYSGTGFFKFAVVNKLGNTSYWSNDGTSTYGDIPTTSIQLTVTDGLFNVLLGDTGQYPLSASVFSSGDCVLRVWFGTDPISFTQLSPDQPITSVPFALQAQTLSQNGCETGQVLMWNGTSWVCQFEIGKVDQATQYLIRSWKTSVDTTGDVGSYSSITIGADGLGLISYYDGTNQDLKVLHCGNLSCSSENTISSVDTNGDVGGFTSITIGEDGLGLIIYKSFTNNYLKALHCGNLLCNSSNTISIIDTTGNVGEGATIVIGADGLGLISYLNITNMDLEVLHCGNLYCSSGNTISNVDTVGNVGGFSSITIGADGLGLVSYYDFSNGDLKVLHCGNLSCTAGNTINSVDTSGNVGQYTSITIGVDGLGLISYHDEENGYLKTLHCGTLLCNSGNTINIVDAAGHEGEASQITIGSDGLGLISYHDITNKSLKILHCGDRSCLFGNTISNIDTDPNESGGIAITIGVDGMGLVAYYSRTPQDLKVAKLTYLGRR